MNALLILIPVTLVLAIVAVGVFFWAVNHAQFEDLESPKLLPLLDENENQGPSAFSDADSRGGPAVSAKVHADPRSHNTHAPDALMQVNRKA